jgi:hypothetical protein
MAEGKKEKDGIRLGLRRRGDFSGIDSSCLNLPRHQLCGNARGSGAGRRWLIGKLLGGELLGFSYSPTKPSSSLPSFS